MTKIYPITTIGALKKLINNLPDNTDIDICNTGTTGFIDGPVELEINTYEEGEPYICLNIRAESGYHY